MECASGLGAGAALRFCGGCTQAYLARAAPGRDKRAAASCCGLARHCTSRGSKAHPRAAARRAGLGGFERPGLDPVAGAGGANRLVDRAAAPPAPARQAGGRAAGTFQLPSRTTLCFGGLARAAVPGPGAGPGPAPAPGAAGARAAAAPAAPAAAGPAAPPDLAAAPGGGAAPDGPSDGAPERGVAGAGDGGGGGGAAAAGGGGDAGGRRFSLRGLFDALAVGLVLQVAGSCVDVKTVQAAPCARSQRLGARPGAPAAAPRFPAQRPRARANLQSCEQTRAPCAVRASAASGAGTVVPVSRQGGGAG